MNINILNIKGLAGLILIGFIISLVLYGVLCDFGNSSSSKINCQVTFISLITIINYIWYIY